MTTLVIALVRCYQRLISPLMGPCCRFIPSCSEYFIEAVRKRGLLAGTLLGIWRVLRCNPFCKGGYDPVR
jgi:putative membrane protein insertion efficiency factor